MLNDGRLRFGVYNGGFDTLDSPAGQNDGNWHHVVATQSGSGMKLFLDDNLVDQNGVSSNQGYSGYWRVGGDNLGAWPDRPNSDYFSGTIDEVAIYGGALVGHPGRRPLPGVRPQWPGRGRPRDGDHLAGRR